MCVGSCALILASVKHAGLEDVECSGDIPGHPAERPRHTEKKCGIRTDLKQLQAVKAFKDIGLYFQT